MKLDIDFENKIITCVSEVNIQDLIDKMKAMNLDLKEWKLQQQAMVLSTYPVYINPQPIIPYYGPPWEITCIGKMIS